MAKKSLSERLCVRIYVSNLLRLATPSWHKQAACEGLMQPARISELKPINALLPNPIQGLNAAKPRLENQRGRRALLH